MVQGRRMPLGSLKLVNICVINSSSVPYTNWQTDFPWSAMALPTRALSFCSKGEDRINKVALGHIWGTVRT